MKDGQIHGIYNEHLNLVRTEEEKQGETKRTKPPKMINILVTNKKGTSTPVKVSREATVDAFIRLLTSIARDANAEASNDDIKIFLKENKKLIEVKRGTKLSDYAQLKKKRARVNLTVPTPEDKEAELKKKEAEAAAKIQAIQRGKKERAELKARQEAAVIEAELKKLAKKKVAELRQQVAVIEAKKEAELRQQKKKLAKKLAKKKKIKELRLKQIMLKNREKDKANKAINAYKPDTDNTKH